jgi:hypothetical protein
MFDYKNGQLVNEKGKVMDVAGHRDRQHNNIGVYRKHHGLNQQFDLIYVDEWKEPPKKGELNEDFGMYVERPFMVRSDLPRGRYLDILGRNMVIKTPNGRNTQMWWFDQRSRTIKNWNNKGWSFDIQGAGKQTNMQAWNTNSGWW